MRRVVLSNPFYMRDGELMVAMDGSTLMKRQATNPEERQRLLRADMALMRENMQLMQGMAGEGATAGPQAGMGMMGGQGGGMMGSMMPGYAAAANGPSTPSNLERRVELLQQVVTQYESCSGKQMAKTACI